MKIGDEEWAEADPDCSSQLIHIMLTNWQSGLLLASLPYIDGCDFTFLNCVHLAVYLYISSYDQGVIICPFVWGRFPEEDSLHHHHWCLSEEDSNVRRIENTWLETDDFYLFFSTVGFYWHVLYWKSITYIKLFILRIFFKKDKRLWNIFFILYLVIFLWTK